MGEKNGMYGKGYLQAGEKGPNHKLTWDDIQLIRLLGFVGKTQNYIARRFGVNQPNISRILHGKSWIESDADRREMEEYLAAMSGVS